MVIFIKLVQYAKNLNGKSLKNLVEHPENTVLNNFEVCFFFKEYHSFRFFRVNRLNALS